MQTILTTKQPVRFLHSQYKIFQTYPEGTRFTLVRFFDGGSLRSARVIAPGGSVGIITLRSAKVIAPGGLVGIISYRPDSMEMKNEKV